MSTGLIIAIVVAAIIIIALIVMLPRMRASARRKQAERELHSRRSTVAEEHRSAAAERESRAEMAEQEARMAEQAAQRERAEANLQTERASLHERGMADQDLIDESERERFQDVAKQPGDDRTDDRRFGRERITDDVRDSERTQR
jgi:Skp family chaperone for outer membrane proteins